MKILHEKLIEYTFKILNNRTTSSCFLESEIINFRYIFYVYNISNRNFFTGFMCISKSYEDNLLISKANLKSNTDFLCWYIKRLAFC